MSCEKSIKLQKRLRGFCGTVVLGATATAFCQAPPANDNFANATVLTGTSITFTGSLAGATFESIETNSSSLFSGVNAGGSVWWTWTAPQSSDVVIEMIRDYTVALPGFTEFHVYSGTNLNALNAGEGNSFDKPSGRYVAFTASAGVTYQFRMAGPMTQPFSLKLTATNAPVILVQPKDAIVSPYGSVLFYAKAALFYPTSYQWKFNGVPIPQQTAPSLVVYNATSNSIGTYSVVVSNSTGVTESSPATLTLVDTNPLPRIAALPPTDANSVSLSLTGQPHRFYQVESSPDLINWGTPTRIGLLNATQVVSIPRIGPTHFVRVWLDARPEACIGQLEQMVWALELYRSENRLPATATYDLTDLRPYLPLTEFGSMMTCPAGGMYISGATVANPPACNIPGHVLDQDWTIDLF